MLNLDAMTRDKTQSNLYKWKNSQRRRSRSKSGRSGTKFPRSRGSSRSSQRSSYDVQAPPLYDPYHAEEDNTCCMVTWIIVGTLVVVSIILGAIFLPKLWAQPEEQAPPSNLVAAIASVVPLPDKCSPKAIGTTVTLAALGGLVYWKWYTIKSWFSKTPAPKVEDEKKETGSMWKSVTGTFSDWTGGYSEYLNPSSYSWAWIAVLPFLPDLFGCGKSFWNYGDKWKCKCGHINSKTKNWYKKDGDGKRKLMNTVRGCQGYKKYESGKNKGQIVRFRDKKPKRCDLEFSKSNTVALPIHYKALNFVGGFWRRINTVPKKCRLFIINSCKCLNGCLNVFKKIFNFVRYSISCVTLGGCCGDSPCAKSCCGVFNVCNGYSCFSCNECCCEEDPASEDGPLPPPGPGEDARRRLRRLLEGEE